MATPNLTNNKSMIKQTAISEKVSKLLAKGSTNSEIAEKLNLKVAAVRKITSSLDESKRVIQDKAPKTQKPRFNCTDNSGEASSVTTTISSLEQLLSTCEVDLKYWEVIRFNVNKWEVGINDGEGGIFIKPLFQVKAFLKKRECRDEATKLTEHFQKLVLDHKPTTVKIETAPREAYLYEISIPDLHIGKLAWSAETGDEDYDSSIACGLLEAACKELISKAPKNQIERILFPLGNDLFNVDSLSRETTGGTPQDEDGRWQKTFTAGVDIVSSALEELSKIAPVDVVVVQGNHDTQRSFYLGESIRNRFHGSRAVNVNNNPTFRKYYSYGKNLIGFTHGDKEKISMLPSLMAKEQRALWSAAEFHEWHLGHLHTEINHRINGCNIRYLSSLSSADAWHAGKGFIGNTRRAEGFLYKKSGGLAANYYFLK